MHIRETDIQSIAATIVLLCILAVSIFIDTNAVNLRINNIQKEPIYNTKLKGAGTKDNPYHINSVEDFLQFAKEVDEGNNFKGKYIQQDIDLKFDDKTINPIGKENKSFDGIYDGAGHSINNLKINNKNGNSALFYKLGGIIVNLAINRDVQISGKNVGSFTVFSKENAAIVNCTTRAYLKGNSASGVAVNFESGTIACILSDCVYDSKNTYGIVGHGIDTRVYRCISTNKRLTPKDIVTTASFYTNSFDKDGLSVKQNAYSELANHIFIQKYGLKTKLWKSTEGELNLTVKENYFRHLYNFIDYYIIPIIITITIFSYIIKGKFSFIEYEGSIKDQEKFYLVTVTQISVFLDSYLLRYGFQYLDNFPLIVSINYILVNFISILQIINYLRNVELSPVARAIEYIKQNISLFILIAFVLIIQITNYGNLPRYDANIYYGSLIRGTELFTPGIISYFASFNCWKWIQGLALFVVPFENIFPRQVIGIYIANSIISIITTILLYELLRIIYTKLNNLKRVLLCGIFLFSPYILGMFTYYDMDWQVACFAIWLIYEVAKNSFAGVCYTGFLISFTKITGMVFYFIICLTSIIFEFFRSSITRQKLIICIALFLPVFLLVILTICGDRISAQAFYGTYVSNGFISLNKNQIYNTFLHVFIFGFRWIFTVLVFIYLVLRIIRYKSSQELFSSNRILLSVCLAFIGIFCLLCLYKSDANCPRYTSIFSSLFVLILPELLYLIDYKRIMIYLSIIYCLFFVQTFYTIDPSILLYCSNIAIGNTNIYKIAYIKDNRVGMNLGKNSGIDILGDIYSYNFEYSFYDDLLREVFDSIDYNGEYIFTLNSDPYELCLNGRGYGTYSIRYDKKRKERTFSNNEDTLAIPCGPLIAKNESFDGDDFGELKEFYVFVPFRCYSEKYIQQIIDHGYDICAFSSYQNIYGKLYVYKFIKK